MGEREALSAAQRGKVRRLAAPATVDESEAGGEINVVPFLDIITNVLMFVLATVAISFTATIDVQPNRPGRGENPSLGLTVLVVPDGFSVKAQGGNVAAGCAEQGAGLAVGKRENAYDFEALRACVQKVKASSPRFADESDVTISANPHIPYDVVVATMDALRKTDGGDALFPKVSLGVAR